ncbi:hypothetical protein [Mycolicibacterium sp. P9-22]|uniref:hypothetical protein n=1 Tax=Mycolicibacterium sp. P9-22 TaxID=2024613 RepID=UPI0011EEF168|nr:hypothetical protein [Mycolicibacterium sp. P9-22]KAA0109960.1 hypothetical protein CIW51_30195 [Mycolicibacterium sp. P9-22]
MKQPTCEYDLAWALTEAAKPYVGEEHRRHLFVKIGAGDTFEAICKLLPILSLQRVSVDGGLLQECKALLGVYAGRGDMRFLRVCIEKLKRCQISVSASDVGVGQVLVHRA